LIGILSTQLLKSSLLADSSPGKGVALFPPLLEHSWHASAPADASVLPNLHCSR